MRSLKNLSDKELLNRLQKLVKQEHNLTLEILPHLIEVENRKIYVSRFNPIKKHRDITRPVAVRVPVAVAGGRKTAGATSQGSSKLSLPTDQMSNAELGKKTLRRGGKKLATGIESDCSGSSAGNEMPTPPEASGVETKTVKMHHVSCLVGDDVMHMLDRCKELLSSKYPRGIDLNTLLEELAAAWLEKNDPVERNRRRIKRKKSHGPKRTDHGETSRHISAATRDAVYERDGGRCTFVGSDGRRCKSKWDVEIHHDAIPFALGGGHSIQNLRSKPNASTERPTWNNSIERSNEPSPGTPAATWQVEFTSYGYKRPVLRRRRSTPSARDKISSRLGKAPGDWRGLDGTCCSRFLFRRFKYSNNRKHIPTAPLYEVTGSVPQIVTTCDEPSESGRRALAHNWRQWQVVKVRIP
jgi:5-methylcytosine-specific restriction endonuclease McrA